jgi:hypothetical protein
MLRVAETVNPEAKSKRLLCEILRGKALQEFLEKDYFHHEGRLGVYRICRDSQTEIYRKDRLVASGCLQLTIFAPTYDRMAAEYLILSNDERLYWTKANIFPVRCEIDFRLVAAAILDLALLVNLLVNLL